MLDEVLLDRDEDFVVVALEIDENRDADAVRDRAQGRASDSSRWVVSPKALTDLLVEEFGPSVIVPPTAPIIVIDAEQTSATLMGAGPKNAAELAEAVDSAR